MSVRKTGVVVVGGGMGGGGGGGGEGGGSPLNAENKRGFTNDVMFAYEHEKINILLSVLRVFSFFFMILI